METLGRRARRQGRWPELREPARPVVPVDGDLDDQSWLAAAEASDSEAWATEFGVERDPTGLFCEANIFRYRSRPRLAMRVEPDGSDRDLTRVLAAAERAGVPVQLSRADEESAADFAARLGDLEVERVRVIGTVSLTLRRAANAAGVHLADDPVTSDGRIELLHYLREQSISRTLHRYGNLL